MKLLLVLFTAGLSFCDNRLPQQNAYPLDELCLTCICMSLTGCNYTSCIWRDEVEYCGPYLLYRTYWRDAGRLGNDFKECALEMDCAKEVVKRYMECYSRDCTNNTIINCADYFRIHLAGYIACHQSYVEEDIHWLKFIECYLNSVNNPREALKHFCN